MVALIYETGAQAHMQMPHTNPQPARSYNLITIYLNLAGQLDRHDPLTSPWLVSWYFSPYINGLQKKLSQMDVHRGFVSGQDGWDGYGWETLLVGFDMMDCVINHHQKDEPESIS